MGKLDGRVAIVTGGARGQGAAEARLFADEGAMVFVTDVLADEGAKTAAGIGGTFVEHDVADPAQWESLVGRVVDDHGRLDILINNAGILRWERMVDTSFESWNEVRRGEPDRCVPRDAHGGAPDDRPAVGLDRQHLVGRWPARRERVLRLRGHEVGGARA